MAFNTQEQEILKWGVQNGKSRQEIETAISNFRSGKVPEKPVQKMEQPSLASQLVERAKTFGKEAVAIGTLGASTLTPEDLQATGQDRNLAALQGITRAGQAPIRMAGAVGGAIGDVVGAGLKATGLAEPLGQALAPVVQSEPVQKAVEVFKSLPQDTQEVLGAIVNTANIPLGGAGVGLARKGVETGFQTAKEVVTPLGKTVLPKITPDAEEIMQRVARVSKGKQANFEQRAGESIGSFLDKRGIYGDIDQISEQLYNRFQKSKQTADDALASLQGNYQPQVIGTALAELEAKLKRVSSPGAVDPQLSEVTGLLAKYKNQGLTMSEINQAKRLYERNVKLDFLKENNPEGVKIANNIDESIRKWQFSQAEKLGLKNLPEINKETMLTRQLLDDIGREYAGSAGNNLVTLTDWIVLSGGDATAVAGFLMKQGLSSKKVQSFIAKMISKNPEKRGVPTPQTGEATVLPIGTYKDFLKETSKTSKPTTQPQVKTKIDSLENTTTVPVKGKGIRGMVNPSELLPKSKVVKSDYLVGSEIKMSEDELFNTMKSVEEKLKEKFLVVEGKKIKKSNSDFMAEQKTVSRIRNYLNEIGFLPKKKAVSSLEQEAKKYKSAEEFATNSTELTYKNLQENPYSIKAYGKDFNEPVEYYRAGAIRKNGDIWLTDNQAGAQQYSSAGGGTKVGSYIVNSKKPLIIDTAGGKYAKGNIDINKILTKEEIAKGYTNNPDIKQKFIDYAKNNGYDAVQFADSFPDGDGGMRSLVVWDKNRIKTKSQLIDIWNKANAGSKVDPLIMEAKKYKSAEEYIDNTAKFVHETNASDIKEFDMSKIGSGQGEAWLGQGIYLQEKGGFKFENYGKNKIETALTPDANIFKIKDTPDGKWRDSFVEWYMNKHPEFEKNMESWESPKNILPRDLLKNRGEYDFGTPTIIKEIKDAGYDGLLQDGELVIYNPKVLKTKSQLTDIWKKANKN